MPLVSGSRGPIPQFVVANLIGVSAIRRAFIDIGYPTPAVFDAPHASLSMPASPHS